MTRFATYTRYELLRTVRNRRFFILSLALPLILYLTIAGSNRNEDNLQGTGLSAPLYFMVGLGSFGAMSAMLSSGARIAAERSVGWNRQLRITPLPARDYFRAKVVTSYLMAGLTLGAIYIAGASLGVSLSAGRWIAMTALLVVGLVPFAAIGIFIGHWLTADSVGPAMGGLVSLFGLLGGSWFPVTGGFLHDLGQLLPSWWLVQAGHIALGGKAWGVEGWAVVAAWTIVFTVAAQRAYRRDTGRT